MRDGFGREINYIRISLTDLCNLHCVYCMPPEGGCSGETDFLSRGEIVRICRCLAQLGVTHVRLTGGEPLLRPELADIIHDIQKIPEMESVTLTTNGVLLADRLQELVSSGLSGVNLSMDSLEAGRYGKISGRPGLSMVLKSLEETRKYPGLAVKINCVPIRGINEDDLPRLALLAKDRELFVRFIELMPIGLGQKFAPVREAEVRKRLQNTLGITLHPCAGVFGNGPARYYTAEGFRGKIGFISALSHKFCDTCSRVRLTCGGYLKTCLQYSTGADLKRPLRTGISDSELTALIRRTIREKPCCHHFGESLGGMLDEQKNMSEIGG